MAHEAEQPTVAHLVTPYLFRTGSWVHAQLVYACGNRPIVLTQRLKDPGAFPFSPVFEVTSSLDRRGRIRNRLLHLAGRFDPGLYLPVLRAEGAALIHAHLGWEGARAWPVARAAGLPLVTSFYGRDAGRLPRYPWWNVRFQRLFQEGDLFFAEGPVLAERLCSLGCPRAKVRVVHVGIDVSRIPFRERSPAPGGEIEVLVSASFRAKKGVPAAVGAFAALAAAFPRVRLRLLGDGPQRRQVLEAVRRANLGDRIVLEGYVSYARHLEALQQAHIFLAPSRTAPDGDSEGGAPVALIEAQAAGLPVVASHHADIPEVVREGVSGLLSPEYDDEALTRNLEWLLANPDQWPEMGRRGRAWIEQGFDVRRIACRSAEIYADLIAAPQARRTGA
ncbi:MAG: glycosyltransferase [Candidatus Eisenbacteria bacterium]